MKYLDYAVTFSEFPDEIALCINISNCKFRCLGCHSPELWEDVGTELTQSKLSKLIDENNGISCIGFMGGQPNIINTFAAYIKNNYKNLKVGWYWGGEYIPKEYIDIRNFDYIKVGPYIKELGPIDCPTTNQRMYKYYISENNIQWKDITYKFWKHENISNS